MVDKSDDDENAFFVVDVLMEVNFDEGIVLVEEFGLEEFCFELILEGLTQKHLLFNVLVEDLAVEEVLDIVFGQHVFEVLCCHQGF